ncbi:FliI/YscN family ATPase [Rhizobacter sp. P5_C2]
MREALLRVARSHPLTAWQGRVLSVGGPTVESSGPAMRMGDCCRIDGAVAGASIEAEVIGLKPGRVVLMPFGSASGIGLGDSVTPLPARAVLPVAAQMTGRVVDAFGQPIDGRPAWAGEAEVSLRPPALNPLTRPPIERVLETGVRAIDTFLTIGRGQRVGIFAGSGVGKSTLLGMLARSMRTEVNVIALIGERGREVREFIDVHLGAEGLQRSVVVVATSDQPAVVRARAALTATALAEHFRAQGRQVLLMMDSVTRFAMARREMDLAAGQPPTARGYTPGVFSEIPALCERAGTAEGGGSITGIYTVLVEGDDHNEPVADTLRATLDGHVVLTRELAHEGHFPAIDVLQSVSRLSSSLVTPAQAQVQAQARAAMASFARHREMIEMGLYRPGSNPELDRASELAAQLKTFLRQRVDESCGWDAAWQSLSQRVSPAGAPR